MGPEYFWFGGMWIFPIIMVIGMFLVIYLIFGRGRITPPWYDESRYYQKQGPSDTPLDILKKRYAKGEITKKEFEEMKQDLQ